MVKKTAPKESFQWEPSALTRLEVDEVWRSVGRYGRYQIIQILTLVVAGLPLAFPVLSVVFEGASNPHTCQAPESFLEEKGVLADNATVTITSEECQIKGFNNDSEERAFVTTHCDSYHYANPRHKSFVSEWDLVCSKAPLAQLSQTIVMGGMCVGAWLLPNLADRFGRMRTQVGCNMGLLVTSLVLAFMPEYVGFLALRFLTGVFQQGCMIPLTVHLLEMLPTENRAALGVLGCLIWSVSVSIMAPIAFLMSQFSWRSLQIVFACCHAFCFLEMFILDESLCWLVANHRFQAIRRVIRKASAYNRKDPEQVLAIALAKSDALRMTEADGLTGASAVLLSSIAEVNEEDAEKATAGSCEAKVPVVEMDIEMQINGDFFHKKNRGDKKPLGGEEGKEGEVDEGASDAFVTAKHHDGFLDLIKDPDMRFFTVSMLYIWAVNSLTYYGVTLLSSSLAGNVYLNFFIGGVMEIPSCLLMWAGLYRWGRKKTMIGFLALAGVSLLAASLVAAFGQGSAAAGVAQTGLSLAARFGISGSFNALWVYTPEVFPTNLRNIGVGIASSSARVAGMAAPFFTLLADVAIWAPGVIFSVACLLAGFLLTRFPETAHRPLPQTISDVKRWQLEDGKGKV